MSRCLCLKVHWLEKIHHRRCWRCWLISAKYTYVLPSLINSLSSSYVLQANVTQEKLQKGPTWVEVWIWVGGCGCDLWSMWNCFPTKYISKKSKSFLINVLLRVLGKVVRPALPSQPEHVDAVVVVRLKQIFRCEMNLRTYLDTKTIHLPFTYFYIRPNVMSYKFGVPRDPPWWVVTAVRARCVSHDNSSYGDKVIYLCQIFFGASRQLVCKSDKVPFADVPSSFYIGWRRQRREVWGQSQPLQEQLSSVCLVKTSSIIIVLIWAYLRLLCR